MSLWLLSGGGWSTLRFKLAKKKEMLLLKAYVSLAIFKNTPSKCTFIIVTNCGQTKYLPSDDNHRRQMDLCNGWHYHYIMCLVGWREGRGTACILWSRTAANLKTLDGSCWETAPVIITNNVKNLARFVSAGLVAGEHRALQRVITAAWQLADRLLMGFYCALPWWRWNHSLHWTKHYEAQGTFSSRLLQPSALRGSGTAFGLGEATDGSTHTSISSILKEIHRGF